MHGDEAEEANTRRLRLERNLFAAFAICCLAAAAATLPWRVASHRELRELNGRLSGLQAALLERQDRIRFTQDQIHQVERLIDKERSK